MREKTVVLVGTPDRNVELAGVLPLPRDVGALDVADALYAIDSDDAISVESFVRACQTSASMVRPFFEDPDGFVHASLDQFR